MMHWGGPVGQPVLLGRKLRLKVILKVTQPSTDRWGQMPVFWYLYVCFLVCFIKYSQLFSLKKQKQILLKWLPLTSSHAVWEHAPSCGHGSTKIIYIYMLETGPRVSPGWSWTPYVTKDALEFLISCLHLPNAGITGVHLPHWADYFSSF